MKEVMTNTSYLKICMYFLVKYVAFYCFLMIKNGNYDTFSSLKEISDMADILYYLWLFLFLPGLSILLFSVPLRFALRTKQRVYFLLILVGIIIAEYFIYTYFASSANMINGIYNGIIGVLILILFFGKRMRLIMGKNRI